MAELPGLVPLENPVEIQQAENPPGRKNQVGFGGKRFDAGDIRNQKIRRKEQRYHQADQSEHLVEPVIFLFRKLPGRRGGKSIGDRCPDGCHIDNPADRRTAEKRQKQRDAQNDEDRMAGNVVLVKFAEITSHQSVIRHRRDQPAQSDVMADETGENSAQGKYAEHCRPAFSQGLMRRKKRRMRHIAAVTVEVCHILRPGGNPFRQCRYRKQCQKRVGNRGCDHCAGKDHKALLQGELRLFRRVADRFKADIGPGGQREDRKDPRPYRTGWRIGNRIDRHASRSHHRGKKERDNSEQHDKRHTDLHLFGELFSEADQSPDHQ